MIHLKKHGSLKSLKLGCTSEQVINYLNGNITYSGICGLAGQERKELNKNTI